MTDAETKILVDAVYGKDKEAKVLRNLKIGQVNAKKKFLEKYPDADVSKFNFEVKLTDEGDIGSYETYFKLTEISDQKIHEKPIPVKQIRFPIQKTGEKVLTHKTHQSSKRDDRQRRKLFLFKRDSELLNDGLQKSYRTKHNRTNPDRSETSPTICGKLRVCRARCSG